MKILLTNDDGYGAEGIEILYKALSKKHEVVIIAPSGQRSATGHGVTFRRPFKVRKVDRGYVVDGSPADCVKLGIRLLAKDVDMIVSGINEGLNIGTDIHYSGTFSAAMEGVLLGKPAVAFSKKMENADDPDVLGALSLRFVERHFSHPLPKGALLNVNYPKQVSLDPMKICYAPIGFCQYEEDYSLAEGSLDDPFANGDENEFTYIGYRQLTGYSADSDWAAVLDGNIVLTPVSWDMTAFDCKDITEKMCLAMKDE